MFLSEETHILTKHYQLKPKNEHNPNVYLRKLLLFVNKNKLIIM
jgi:hypothetical protein